MPTRFLYYRSAYYPGGVVGLANADESTVTPLKFPSGFPVTSLFDVVENWDVVKASFVRSAPEEKVADVEVQAPFKGRDVLCVGKNYKAHAREFQQSGYDSSDKNEQPDFPVIFTKRATSIVPTNTPIYLHPSVSSTVDYEGELGIVIGKPGFAIKKEDAWNHVWGAVIVNDVTARERQRDHKQFYIGKSLDTFCPMGPYAVPASELDWATMMLETRVNGELRQSQNTSELIFDIPTLIETCSMGITLQPGDVIATGTPAGVGIGLKPPVFLKGGDKIDITITGLGTLSNVVQMEDNPAPSCESVRQSTATLNSPADPGTQVGQAHLQSGIYLHTERRGSPSAPETILFIHGLLGASTNFDALLQVSGLDDSPLHQVITFDLEGHGLSRLSGRKITMDTYVQSALDVLEYWGVSAAAVVGHNLGGLIGLHLARRYPERFYKLLLLSPLSPDWENGETVLPETGKAVRTTGSSAQVANILAAEVSPSAPPLAQAAVRASILMTPPEVVAGVCEALESVPTARTTAGFENLAREVVKGSVLVIGTDAAKKRAERLSTILQGVKVVRLDGVNSWPMLEEVEGVAGELKNFL